MSRWMTALAAAAWWPVAAAALSALAGPAAPSTAPAPAGSDAPAIKAFQALCAQRARQAVEADTLTVVGRDGWLFQCEELRHLGRVFSRPWVQAPLSGGAPAGGLAPARAADPASAILDFKAQLDARRIELILLPVPPKAIIYPDKLLDNPPRDAAGRPVRLDPVHREFYRSLRDGGVTVLDLTDDFLAARPGPASQPDAAEMYCRQDTHWSGQGCILAARRIAEHVKGRPWLTGLTRRKLHTASRIVQITGDLWEDLKTADGAKGANGAKGTSGTSGPGGERPPKEKLPLRFVGGASGASVASVASGESAESAEGGLAPLAPDPGSPIVLLSDSHGLVFSIGEELHARGAGLPDQLAWEFGSPVDLIGARASGVTPVRIDLAQKARANPQYLAGKKLIIWCFAAREFSETSDWRKVPLPQ